MIEAPPESLCVVDDFWFRYVADMGIAGPDKGRGWQYLYFPPGYEGERPDDYFVYRCPTYTNRPTPTGWCSALSAALPT